MIPFNLYQLGCVAWKGVLRFAGIFLLACEASLHAQVNAQDSILTAHLLDDTESASFSTNDGVIAPFWSQWQGRDSLVVSSDTFGGSQARITVKAAVTEVGVFLFAEVVDDSLAQGSEDRYDDGFIFIIGNL